MSPCRKAVGDLWRGLRGNGFRFTRPLFDRASRKNHRRSPLAQKHGKFSLPSDLACTTSLMLSNLGSHKTPPSNGEKAEKSSGGLGTFLPPKHLINAERLIYIENKRICP